MAVEATKGATDTAKELGISLADVPHAGAKVTKGEVLAFAASQGTAPTEQAYAPPKPGSTSEPAIISLPTDQDLAGQLGTGATPNIGSHVLIRPQQITGVVIGAVLSDGICPGCTGGAGRELTLSADRRQIWLVTRCRQAKCPGKPLIEKLEGADGKPDLKTCAEILAGEPAVKFLVWTPGGGDRNTATLQPDRLRVLP